jgi:hypothetical protein
LRLPPACCQTWRRTAQQIVLPWRPPAPSRP